MQILGYVKSSDTLNAKPKFLEKQSLQQHAQNLKLHKGTSARLTFFCRLRGALIQKYTRAMFYISQRLVTFKCPQKGIIIGSTHSFGAACHITPYSSSSEANSNGRLQALWGEALMRENKTKEFNFSMHESIPGPWSTLCLPSLTWWGQIQASSPAVHGWRPTWYYTLSSHKPQSSLQTWPIGRKCAWQCLKVRSTRGSPHPWPRALTRRTRRRR